jgi:hypothetical protein
MCPLAFSSVNRALQVWWRNSSATSTSSQVAP